MFFTRKRERVEELSKRLNERIAFLRQRLADGSISEEEKEGIRAKLSKLQESVHNDTKKCRNSKER